ncbi:hypothetical protein EDB89DRAFT_1987251 [Lactarius sanguifluus]|nr:hypothetical protein EDB89DRAFT_1987251 [Lactarius sanguifluus]
MVYTLLSNRTRVRRTNDVLNLLAIYAINCGTLHLVFAITCLILFVRYPETFIYITPSFIMVRLSLCAFMAILNSRDHLRETLDGPEGGAVVLTLTHTSRGGTQPSAPAYETPSPKQTSTGKPPSRSVFPQFRFPHTRRSSQKASYLFTETNITQGV